MDYFVKSNAKSFKSKGFGSIVLPNEAISRPLRTFPSSERYMRFEDN